MGESTALPEDLYNPGSSESGKTGFNFGERTRAYCNLRRRRSTSSQPAMTGAKSKMSVASMARYVPRRANFPMRFKTEWRGGGRRVTGGVSGMVFFSVAPGGDNACGLLAAETVVNLRAGRGVMGRVTSNRPVVPASQPSGFDCGAGGCVEFVMTGPDIGFLRPLHSLRNTFVEIRVNSASKWKSARALLSSSFAIFRCQNDPRDEKFVHNT